VSDGRLEKQNCGSQFQISIYKISLTFSLLGRGS
jgi:hypothetical protein